MTASHRVKTANLALQGGGAHGAFTWGVLDRLLEEKRLAVEGISGTSAGAMNAAMFKTGWVAGGNTGARDQLDRFWGSIRRDAAARFNPLRDWLALLGPEAAEVATQLYRSPAYAIGDALQRSLSPYDWNPLNYHPLRDLLEEMVDWPAVCRDCVPHLFVSATNVETGKIRVFQDAELSIDVLLASACLPTLFQAIEIDGQPYWDGGYTGNPALFPLFRMPGRDIVIVHINPIERPGVPKTARDILNRINEISFNSSLLRELRAIDFAHRLIESGRIGRGEMADVLIHSIRDDATMAELNVASKMMPDPALLDHLRAKGIEAADAFLRRHWGELGARGTVDLRAMFA